MPDHLCITVRFLDGAFHGRADHGEPEWPPSPLRLFQATIAAAAARWNERRGLAHAVAALKWMEQVPAPTIVAPPAREAEGYRLYVPDNAGDRAGGSWSRGGEDSIANYRTEKSVRPMVFPAEEAVHYLWSVDALPDGFAEHREILFKAVRSVTHLGWGVDPVTATASILDNAIASSLRGEFWRPNATGSLDLRAPQAGTFDDLVRRYDAFLHRVTSDGFAPVPPLSDFAVVGYQSDARPASVPHAVFALRSLDGGSFKAFDLARRGLHVAGMLRHAASQPDFLTSVGWSEEEGRSLVLGHGEARGGKHQAVAGPRLSFIPLPSIEPREKGLVVTSIRRVLVTMTGAADATAFNRFVQRLEGRELIDEKTGDPVAILQRQLSREDAIRAYLAQASTWASVTPVILPGYDDPRKLRQRLKPGHNLTADEKADVLSKLDQRVDTLLRKAIRQAGYSETLATHAELDWRATSFYRGTHLATQYAVPEQHRRYRRLHLRLTWRGPQGRPLQLPGPLCFGGGKFSGLGLFAALRPPMRNSMPINASIVPS
jgi:CRISPR-associated protein Csb2